MDRLTALRQTVGPAPTFDGPPCPALAGREDACAVGGKCSFAHGFTLTEMAVVLVIVALLIGSMILPMSAQQDLRYVSETDKTLSDVTEALYGYAAAHTASDGKPYLPCPASDTNGKEATRTSNACPAEEGYLPWADLGIGRQDAWGNTLRYRVTAGFSNSATGFTLTSSGDLKICETSACSTELATSIPAVVFSLGKNGASTTTDTDELENQDTDTVFVDRTQSGTSGGYDDLVVWIPAPLLINRMISAGRLP